jgi:integrase
MRAILDRACRVVALDPTAALDFRATGRGRPAVRVDEATAELDDGRLLDDTPKSKAGKRWVSFPREIVPEIRAHLDEFAQKGKTGLVFVGPKGARLRRSTFRRTWVKAREAIGWPALHFHDLRHTGNNWSAQSGATIKELMARMGHSSTRAAMIYLHATRERDRAIADSVGKNVAKKLQKKIAKPSGTQRARKRKRTT